MLSTWNTLRGEGDAPGCIRCEWCNVGCSGGVMELEGGWRGWGGPAEKHERADQVSSHVNSSSLFGNPVTTKTDESVTLFPIKRGEVKGSFKLYQKPTVLTVTDFPQLFVSYMYSCVTPYWKSDKWLPLIPTLALSLFTNCSSRQRVQWPRLNSTLSVIKNPQLQHPMHPYLIFAILDGPFAASIWLMLISSL